MIFINKFNKKIILNNIVNNHENEFYPEIFCNYSNTRSSFSYIGILHIYTIKAIYYLFVSYYYVGNWTSSTTKKIL